MPIVDNSGEINIKDGRHPVIEKILDYRQLCKLNSTYVEGLIPYINEKDNNFKFVRGYFSARKKV